MTIEVLPINIVRQIMTAASGSAAHVTSNSGDAAMLGKDLDMTNCLSASIQFVWTGFTSADASIIVECTDVLAAGYIQKSSAVYIIPAGAGTNSFSLNEIITEKFYRVRFAPGTNAGGTISCYIKGTKSGIHQ